MKNRIWIAGVVLLAVLLFLQVFQPERNLGEPDNMNDLVESLGMPDSLAVVLKRSCYDCHSNRTEYPWYSYIAPVSWYLDNHIRKGKDHVNFNSFGALEKSGKIGVLSDICEEVESGSMPLKSYTLIHGNARVSDIEKEALCRWAELESLKIMRE